jgi:HEAT repeat protein
VGDDEAYLLVSKALEDRSAIVRIAAVWSLHEFKGRDALAAITRAGQDSDPEVREAVVVVLAKREGAPATQAMIQMLLRGETNSRVRRLLVDSLAARGLAGEKLTGEMAENQLGLVQKQLAEGSTQGRIQALALAGRSVHPGAIDLLLAGVEQEDGEVVQAAVAALHGRGGTEALRRLQLLLADPMQGLRLTAVRALPDYGEHGLTLVEGALRDADAEVRLAALEELAARKHAADPQVLCALLLDEDPRVAVEAAGQLASRSTGCELAGLEAALVASEEGPTFRRLVGVLGVLGGPTAVALLEREQARRKPTAPAFLLAARVRAGDRRPGLLKEVVQALQHGLAEAGSLVQSWPKDKLGPGVELVPPLPAEPGEDDEEAEREDQPEEAGAASPDAGLAAKKRQTQLSEDELKALYQKHKLGDLRADSPRGIGDILNAFPEKAARAVDDRLFPAIQASDLSDLALLVEALGRLEPARVAEAAEAVLALGQTSATAELAGALLGLPEVFRPSEAGLQALTRALAAADAVQTAPIAALLIRAELPQAAQLLAAVLEPADWEKRDVLIEALGRPGAKAALQPLAGMLKGYSAIAAARALAALGDPAGVEPLKAALGQAGPVEEMEILMALARLGDASELPRLLEKLDNPDPDMRRAAVRILGVVGTPEAREAVKALRYDLDRLVREEVQLITEGVAPAADDGSKAPGDKRDGEHP